MILDSEHTLAPKPREYEEAEEDFVMVHKRPVFVWADSVRSLQAKPRSRYMVEAIKTTKEQSSS